MKRKNILWGVATAVLAATAWSGSFMDVRPGIVELSSLPGRSIKGHLVLRNSGAEPLPVRVEVQDGWSESTGRQSIVSPKDWLTLKVPDHFVVNPNDEKKIPYRIRVPDQLTGEVMALIFFSGAPQQGPSQGVGVRFRHGIPIYLSVQGTERADLSFKDALVTKTDTGALEFLVTLLSEGNAHVRPRGEWRVTDVFGGEVETVPLGYGMPVFPGASRPYFATSKRSSYAPGRYKAHLTVTYGEGWSSPKTASKIYSLTVEEGKVSLAEEGTDGR